MMKLKINMWTGILDIVNCVLFAVSWFVIFGTAFSDATTGGNATGGASAFFYIMAWVGVVLNIVALVKSKRLISPLWVQSWGLLEVHCSE